MPPLLTRSNDFTCLLCFVRGSALESQSKADKDTGISIKNFKEALRLIRERKYVRRTADKYDPSCTDAIQELTLPTEDMGSGRSASVRALVLPRGLRWPTLPEQDEKQRTADMPNVYMMRCSETSTAIGREEETIR